MDMMEANRKRAMVAMFIALFRGNTQIIQNRFVSESIGTAGLSLERHLPEERRAKVPRTENYAEVTVPLQSLDDFRSHFRLSRTTFEVLLGELQPCPEIALGQHGFGSPPVELGKQALVFLWYLGSPDSFRSISDRFGISRSTTHCICRRVCKAVVNNLIKKLISWPSHENRVNISEGFEKYSHFPGAIGAIDGCHIKIKAPTKNPNSYVNRKKFHSVVLQGVCDDALAFTHVYTGWPGCTHDARVFNNSSVFQEAAAKFETDEFLLGDSAYPIQPWLMTPYKDYGNITRDQKRYNKRHNSARVVIERAFGQLKGRFRRLRDFDCSDFELLCHSILAACVMHNLCLKNNDDTLEELQLDEENAAMPRPHHHRTSGIEKRRELEMLLARRD
ncbi:putative nuclease HARBI1 [Lineus longissimus]|uniref:putative nuclease HARBI1 n=1 Tax=Lineus longissimus TaxID=88925 RepID=UPI00315D2D96